MYYLYGYKDHSRPPVVSFHIYIWMVCYHLGTKGNRSDNYLVPFKFVCRSPRCCQNIFDYGR